MPRSLVRVVRQIRTLVWRDSARGAKPRAAAVLFALVVCPGLSGCILGLERPELNLDVPAAYRAGPKGAAADTAVPAVDWWRGFRSSELTALMDAAQAYNYDIAVAIAQIIQADAQVGVSGAALLPTVSGMLAPSASVPRDPAPAASLALTPATRHSRSIRPA
jgi:multidrug efflux system outer membrane protein